MRRLMGVVLALLTLFFSTALAVPAQAAPLPATYTGSAGGDVLRADVAADGPDDPLDLAAVRLATSAATADSSIPQTSAQSANLAAEVAGLPVSVSTAGQTAPPDNASPVTGTLASVSGAGIESGTVTYSDQARFTSPTTCTPSRLLSTSQTSTTGASISPLSLIDVLTTGDAYSQGVTELVPTAVGSANHAVRSTSSGQISGISLLGADIAVDIAGTPTLTATAGAPGGPTTAYDSGVVTVTQDGGTPVPLAPGSQVELTSGLLDVTIRANQPTVTPLANGISTRVSVVTITVVGDVGAGSVNTTINLLPLASSATAPADGIDCPAIPDAPTLVTPVDGSVTLDTTPTFSGTAEADSTVEVFVDGDSIGTTTADPTGAWTFTPTTPLAPGEHEATATATNEVGTSAESNTNTFTIDVAAPPAPVITAPADGSTVGSPVTIGGTAEAGSTVTVSIDDVEVGTTTTDENGDWTLVPPVDLASGEYTATAIAADAAGNESPTSEPVDFVVDADAPADPVLVDPVDGLVTSDPTPEFTGSAEPDSDVEIFVDGGSIGTTTTDGTGAWTFVPTTPLAQGAHDAYVVATDAAGNESGQSNTNTFIIDTEIDPPVVTEPDDGDLVDTGTPTYTGTAEAGADVEVFVDGVPIGIVPATGGTWTIAQPTTLPDGPHRVYAVATDAASNVSDPSVTVDFLVDTQAPDAPVLTTPVDQSVTSDTTPEFSGTAEADSTVEVFVDGTPIGTTTADPNGAWTFTPTTGTPQGRHEAYATSTDATGNVSELSNTNTFRIDSVEPDAPVITAPAEGSVTTDTTPAITGTAEPNTQVTVRLDGAVLGTAPVDGNGAWTLTPTTPLPDDTYAATATATDAAGNVSDPSAPVSFTVDSTVAPPVITEPADGSSTNDTTPAISGSAEPGASVVVSLDGSPLPAVTADQDGIWTTTPAAPLAGGPHVATAIQTDQAGNQSGPSESVTFTVDTTVVAPVITSPTPNATLADSTPEITGTGEPGATVAVTIDGAEAGTAVVDPLGTWSLTADELADGDHLVSASQTDEAGNVSGPTDDVPFRIDSSADAPTITAPADGDVTTDSTPEITGTGEADATVVVTIDGIEQAPVATDDDGSWTVTPTSPLDDGPHTITAVLTDELGNESAESEPVQFVVDTMADAPVIADPEDGDQIDDSTPTIRGSAEPGATVVVTLDGQQLAPVVADEDGSWSVTPTTPLDDGEHTVSAVQTDPVGNTSGRSARIGFTIDTVAPGAPVVIDPADGSSSTDRLPVYRGTAPAGTTVAVFVDGRLVGFALTSGLQGSLTPGQDPEPAEGTWQLAEPRPLSTGRHAVMAYALDDAGNVSEPSNTNVFFVTAGAVAAPDAPVITSPAEGASTTDPTPPLTGTGLPGATVVVEVDGTGVGSTGVGADGRWGFTLLDALGIGSHTVTIYQVDGNGVRSASTSVSFVVVAGGSGPSLPGTGGPDLTVMLLGLAFTGLGIALVRRRRR